MLQATTQIAAEEPNARMKAILSATAEREPTARMLGALFDVMSTMRRRRAETAGTTAILTKLAGAGPLRSSDLADSMGLDQSTVSRHVTSLESEGLVERHPAADDRRAHLLELTDLGISTARERIAAKVAFFEGALASWDDTDLQTFAILLDRFAKDLITTEGNSTT